MRQRDRQTDHATEKCAESMAVGRIASAA